MEVFRYALGAVRAKPDLARCSPARRSDVFRLRRPDGFEVEFKTGVATSGGTAARGQWWTDFALDECAFFRDSSFKVNDEEMFRAGSARVLPGGQTIIASTPWAEAGLLHRMWKKRPDDTAVIHAPTLALNDSELTRSIIARAEESDPDNAKREFGAQFMTTGTTVFFESSCLDAATVDEPFEVQAGDSIAAGGDFGFRADSSALIMVALRGGIVHLFDGTEERPGDAPLKPSVTVAAFATTIAGRCSYLMADGHYREAISELLEAHDLSYAPAPTQPADTYVRARMLLREGRIKIHGVAFRERLLQQLREVHGKPTSGGGMSIVHPRWATGGHGDLAAAFVLAVWQPATSCSGGRMGRGSEGAAAVAARRAAGEARVDGARCGDGQRRVRALEEVTMAKKSDRAAMEQRTAELKRLAEVDNENVALRLQVAEQDAELARLRRQAEAEKAARLRVEERLVWVCKLSGGGMRPKDLGD
jgi:hypothetical protein